MNLLNIIKSDFIKYKEYSGGKGFLSLFFVIRGLRAIFWFRIFSMVYRSDLSQFIKKPLLIFGLIIKAITISKSGIDIPYSAVIGKQFYIGHFGNIIFNANTIIGDNCNISQGVTIGVSGRGEKRGTPIIGNNVYIGANSVIAGKIKVGNDVLIGANTLVTFDVPDHATVIGSPGVIINNKGSKGYI